MISTPLHCLAEYCGYGEAYDKMIKDWLVVGPCDASLWESLHINADHTPEKAISTASQSEAAS